MQEFYDQRTLISDHWFPFREPVPYIPRTGVVVGGVTRGAMRSATLITTESGWTRLCFSSEV